MPRLPLAVAAIAVLLVGCESKTPMGPATVETTLIPPIVTPPATRASADFVNDGPNGPVQMTLFFQLKTSAAPASVTASKGVNPQALTVMKTCSMHFDGELRPDRLNFWVFKAEDDASCGTGRLPLEGTFTMRRTPAVTPPTNPAQPVEYEVTGTYTMKDNSQGAVNGTLTGSLNEPSSLSGTLTTRVDVPVPEPPAGSATVVYSGAATNPTQPNVMEVTFQLESTTSATNALVFCSVNMTGRLTGAGIELGTISQVDPPGTPCSAPPFTSIALPLASNQAPLTRGRWRFFATYAAPGGGRGVCEGLAVGAPPSDAVLQDVVCRHSG